MLSLIVPIYRNEANIPTLLAAVSDLNQQLSGQLQAIFVVDGSPDRSYALLAEQLPSQDFNARLILLSRNFGSFPAIRAGLQQADGDHFAVMAADLQEPPELILEMEKALSQDQADVVIGVRQSRHDPLPGRLASAVFWGLYRRYVVPDMPPGGVDIFACNQAFRDQLLQLEERHSSLVAQVFWLGFRRVQIPYVRRARQHGKSAWTLHKKLNYLMDSVFAFTDLPIRILIRVGAAGAVLSGLFGGLVALLRLFGEIGVPGYAATMLAITFLGSLNLLGLGIVGSYAWRSYENTKHRPLAVILKIDDIRR